MNSRHPAVMLSVSLGLALFAAQSIAYPKMNQVATFHSRPDLSPPSFEITVYDANRISPGYLIMAPYTAPLDSNLAAGSVPAGINGLGGDCATQSAEVQTIEGEAVQNRPYGLVFSGYGNTGAQYSHDLKVAQYNGSPHFTFYNGNDATGGNRGHGVIIDSTYRIVNTVSSGLGRTSNDSHEFTVLPGGTALTTIFQPTQYDLTAYGINQPWGWVLQGICQEIVIETGEVVFEWASLDHVDPSESYNPNTIQATGGNGSTVDLAWDYFHMNSIEKDSDGNYLISSRYIGVLFMIDGKDGSIIWQLNGKKNQFTFKGFNNTFSFQHHARILSKNETTTIISLFDNGSDGAITNSSVSSGMIMAVDTSTMTCTLLHEYYLPDPVSSTSQGSVQIMDNSTNVFIGWGSQPYISEHLEDGTCVMTAQFASNESLSMNYRAFKGDWTGNPDSTPALWSYANSSSSPTTFYTSWNGATEVAEWRFYGGAGAKNASQILGTTVRTGFETSFVANRFYAWGYAEALDQSGNSLGKSPVKQTYVVGRMTNVTTSARR